MNIQTYTLPDFWASTLINGDPLEDDADENALNQWFDATFPNGAHCLSVSDDDDDGGNFMRWHDAAQYVLACNVLEYTFDVGEA